MAKADQKVTTPQPIWIFLWVFGLITVCFLTGHHWHYKLKAKSLKPQPYVPIRQDFKVSDVTKAKSLGQLKTLEGGTALANLNVQ